MLYVITHASARTILGTILEPYGQDGVVLQTVQTTVLGAS